MMIWFLLLLSTVFFVVFLILFFNYGEILGYNTRVKATAKAFIFAVIVFGTYILPLYLSGRDSGIAFFLISAWSCFWFFVVYKQATVSWGRVTKQKSRDIKI